MDELLTRSSPLRAGEGPPRRADIFRVTTLLVLLLLPCLVPGTRGLAFEEGTPESPSELLKRAETLVASDLDAAIDLFRKAADAAQASRNDIDIEAAARWQLTQLLRRSLLSGRTETARLSLYRNQLTRLGELLPAAEPRAELDLLRAELALILNDASEAIAHARAAAQSAPPDEGHQEFPKTSVPLGVGSRTVALLLGIALARKAPPLEDEPIVALTYALRGPINPRFQNWIPNGLTELLIAYGTRVALGQYAEPEGLLEIFAPSLQSVRSVGLRALIMLQAANLAILLGHLEQAATFADEASALLSAEPDPFRKGVVLSALLAPLLKLDRLQQAEETFAVAADLLASTPEGRSYLLKTVETTILPVIEGLDLAQSGAALWSPLRSTPLSHGSTRGPSRPNRSWRFGRGQRWLTAPHRIGRLCKTSGSLPRG